MSLLRHLHTVGILGLLYLGFSALVRDPEGALAGSQLYGLILLQTLYVVFGLDLRARARKKSKPPSLFESLQTAALSFIFTSAVAPLFFCIIILYGAPITDLLLKTFLTAYHISVLSIFPLVFVHHLDAKKWHAIVSLQLPLDEVYGGTLGTWLGAYLGAIPIPLDWDREWQKWPITIITGAYLGYAIGKVVGFTWSERAKRRVKTE